MSSVDTLIRVGSCGAIQSDVSVGDLVITTGAVRGEGTCDEYVRKGYPATADHEVVSALIAAAERLDHDYHVGTTLSRGSFHAGQARETLAGIYGIRAGAVCAVYVNRTTGEFRTSGERWAAETASLAVALLARMDERKREAGVDQWHAGLSL